MRFSPFCLLVFILLIFSQLADAQKIRKRKIRKLFEHSEIVNGHFTGFALYDLDRQKMIWEQNADKYFTPASNTKLFTFYTSLRMLGDSLPALRYVTRGDSLIFWATGDPSFLHSYLKSTRALEFLKRSNKKLFFSSGWYRNGIYGSGWAWNDYDSYYQAEITELPMQDNVAIVYSDTTGQLKIKPAYLTPYLRVDTTYHPDRYSVKRAFSDNIFSYPADAVPKNFKQEIPWKTSAELTMAMLQDTLKLPVAELHIRLPIDARTLYSMPADSVYRRMLQPSDNFIAEQLLLVCSATRFGELNKDSVINYAMKNLLADLPDKPQWADGSGLSRYNLFTPRTMIALLLKILNEVKDENRLHSMMPIGGVAGTIRNAYKTDNGVPFVWAKTGSLSNNHNQSGYLTTRKGRRLAFSFMNNNFVRPTADIRNEMVRIITYIHERF